MQNYYTLTQKQKIFGKIDVKIFKRFYVDNFGINYFYDYKKN